MISVEGVAKKYCRSLSQALRYGVADVLSDLTVWRGARKAGLREGEFWAVRDVSFTLGAGEALGVIGDNGAGKTTLLKMLNGLLKPDAGRIKLNGRVGALDLGSAMMPALTGHENIMAQGALYGLKETEIRQRFDAILDFADIGEFIESPVGFYSSGMKARLAFAIASEAKLDVLLVDETLSVGDLNFQRKCLEFIASYLREGGSLVFVGHSAYHIQTVCHQGLVLEQGRTVFAGNAVEAMAYYQKSKAAPAAEDSQGTTAEMPVVLQEITIAPVTTKTLQTGQPAVVTVRYEASEPFSQVVWGLFVTAPDGVTNTLAVTPSLARSLPAGNGVICCRIQRLPLYDGAYGLKVVLRDIDTQATLAIHGWHNPPVRFEVASPLRPFRNLMAQTGVFVDLEADWETLA
jgi:lipopolysaccharide transport system ATP-binding protein